MMNVQKAYDNFILSRQLADLSLKSISAYEQFITPFISVVGSNTLICDITQDNINNYISEVLKRPLSKSTRATYIRHVKIFLRWIQNEYAVTSYDYKKIRVPKSPKKNVKIYTHEEFMQIMDTVAAESEWMTIRNKCIIALMYDSGLRQAEVCSLRKKRVSFSERRMVVTGKGSKDRTVPLGNLTYALLCEYMALCPYESEMMFVNRRGEPLTCNAVKLLVSKIGKNLDFEFSSHKLRHNFATNYCIDQTEQNGQPDIYKLKTMMGHESIDTTMRYLHLANEIIGVKNHISHLDMVYRGKF